MLYGQAVKQATVAQNTNDVRVANQNNFGDDSVKYKPFLKPEKITTFEFGYTFVDKPSRWEINANVFQNNLSNLITRETSFDGTDYIAFSTNSGEIRTRGVELILKKVVRIPIGSKKLILNTNGSVTYQVTKHIKILCLFLWAKPNPRHCQLNFFRTQLLALKMPNLLGVPMTVVHNHMWMFLRPLLHAVTVR